jgi:pyruvate,orthophosphate dikinase
MTKWVYQFGGEKTDGRSDMRNLLGGKGANLAEMANMGLPVPPGFTITTEVCTYYYDNGQQYPDELKQQVEEALASIERDQGKKFGDPSDPLLMSVRSGARISMPGMMDTVLNLGLNEETVKGLAEKANDERFAWDSYRRFINMYGDVVLGVPHEKFEEILEEYKNAHGLDLDVKITAEGWKEIVPKYRKLVEDHTGEPFPTDPMEQLWGGIGAVFSSWMVPRAVSYRKIHEIPGDWGTAVNVQTMVFGNMGEDCATGVAFTRDPSTGENYFYGEYLINAQGEDVVAGIRTPQALTETGKERDGSSLPSMEVTMPKLFTELDDVRHKLEQHFCEIQDLEFTIERDKLYILQTRTGKRTAAASLKIATDMVEEGLISKDEAVLRIDPKQLDHLLHPRLDPDAEKEAIATGLPASPGAACGEVYFSADEAEAQAGEGKNVILCRTETSPEDIHGMHAAVGILTSRGGMTSHAAVVARGMGKPCVAGAGALSISYKDRTITVDGTVVKEGEKITLDGGTGEVIIGEVPTLQPELSGDFAKLMVWADERRRMRVRANAETPADAQQAREFGCEGIGLCRTEHMFFDPERIQSVREMIFASDEDGRRKALARLLPYQRDDFAQLFEIMQGLPVTIRLLDPPLHEFLPHGDKDIGQFAKTAGLEVEQVRRRLDELHEFNPMLGHRGCRLGISYPEIYEMQAQAIFEGAIECAKKTGETVVPEVMIPLVATQKELAILRERTIAVADKVFEEKGMNLEYMVGTMIELPRAALCADSIAKEAEFFSFGTNDLTQTGLGMSRDDAAVFLGEYVEQGIFEKDPFQSLDQEGVGQLMEIACEKGRQTVPDIKLGICGEHGGDPSSIGFCEKVGLDYVSCSPFRVPIARLSAAQSAIREGKRGKARKAA